MDAAFFAKDAVTPREVKLPDGSVHVIHFRELPAVEFRKFQIAEQSENTETRAASIAQLIAASVCEPDGKPAMTVKRAMQLNSYAANELVRHILEVNGITADAKKDSPPEE